MKDVEDGDGDEEETRSVVDGGVLEEVQQFCYSGMCWMAKHEWEEQSKQE